MYHQALWNLMAKFMDGLPLEIQQQLQSMEPEEMEKELLNMMGAFEEEEPQPMEQPMPEAMPPINSVQMTMDGGEM